MIPDTSPACRAVSYPQIMPRQPKPSKSVNIGPGRSSSSPALSVELDLLRRNSPPRSPRCKSRLQLGIGDDCALLRPAPGEELAVTTDLSIAGRHFRLDWHPAESIGHRALARGLCDLAAMGARPVAAFLSLALPPNLVQDSKARSAAFQSASHDSAARRSAPAPAVIDRFLDGFFEMPMPTSCRQPAAISPGPARLSPTSSYTSAVSAGEHSSSLRRQARRPHLRHRSIGRSSYRPPSTSPHFKPPRYQTRALTLKSHRRCRPFRLASRPLLRPASFPTPRVRSRSPWARAQCAGYRRHRLERRPLHRPRPSLRRIRRCSRTRRRCPALRQRCNTHSGSQQRRRLRAPLHCAARRPHPIEH